MADNPSTYYAREQEVAELRDEIRRLREEQEHQKQHDGNGHDGQKQQAEQKKDALEKLATSIVGDVNGGRSLKDVAGAHRLTVTTSQPLARTGDTPTAPPALIAALFEAKANGAVSAPAGDDVVIAQLKSIQPADPSTDQAGVKQLSDQLAGAMKSDMLDAFTRTLRANFPVEINQANLDHVL